MWLNLIKYHQIFYISYVRYKYCIDHYINIALTNNFYSLTLKDNILSHVLEILSALKEALCRHCQNKNIKRSHQEIVSGIWYHSSFVSLWLLFNVDETIQTWFIINGGYPRLNITFDMAIPLFFHRLALLCICTIATFFQTSNSHCK